MGFLLRAALVVGVVYWLSPLRDPDDAAAARDYVQAKAATAGAAALDYCIKSPATCQSAATLAAPPAERPKAAPKTAP